MKYIYFIIIYIMVAVAIARAEDQIAVKYYYHAWESGHTYVNSEVKDREFDGFGYGLEYLKWWDNLGLSVSGCKNMKVNEEMFPNWKYKGELSSVSLIGQYRDEGFRIGVGANYSYLKNKYGKVSGERIDGIGWIVLIGYDYFIENWGIGINSKYIRNDLKSNIQGKTNYRIGGWVNELMIIYRWGY